VRDEGDHSAADESHTDLEPRPSPMGEAPPPPPLQCGALLGGRYEIRKMIGRGGMGLVVEAFDRMLATTVAIKIVRAEYAGERTWAERLAREVKLARQIHHPNVCRVFDFAQADGRVFLIMELATGGTIRSEIASAATKSRPLAERIADARALATGLGAIHAAGIVHRDLSPQNLLRMADGRVVLSDFGLATDSFETTTSIRGGTIAYMAPELVKGERASVASDLWALGVLIHEIVFGERPHWRPRAGEMSNPIAGRRLTPAERAVLEACRACTAMNPERRPPAASIAARLSESRLRRFGWHSWTRRALVAAGVGFAAFAFVAGVGRLRAGRAPAVAADPLLIVPTGEPEDWTDKSIVLAEVPDKIRCASLLPDHRTVRFVWGHPTHAEDLDTHTGQRKPSPLVPAAYAEGCPDVSPDGQRMVYAGHTADNRAFVFVSNHPDGSDATPAVQSAEPTMDSDPIWLPDNESFSYDADFSNMAVFSLATKRSTILPRVNTPKLVTSFRHVVDNQIVVTGFGDGLGSDLVGWKWPSLTETFRFRYSNSVLDFQTTTGRPYYFSEGTLGEFNPIVKIDPFARTARRIGGLREQFVRHPIAVADGLVFVSIKRVGSLLTRGADGRWSKALIDPSIWAVGICGKGIVATRSTGVSSVIVRLDPHGKIIRQLTAGPLDVSPACSADGKTLFYVAFGEQAGFNGTINICEATGCRPLLRDSGMDLAISPNDRRIAFLSVDNRGTIIRWMNVKGAEVHDLIETETACGPIWSSDRDLWVSRRRGHETVWTEIDVETGDPTGKIIPGTQDCSDGTTDPASPTNAGARLVIDRKSQLRLLPADLLAIK
jgi:hypothetical protein